MVPECRETRSHLAFTSIEQAGQLLVRGAASGCRAEMDCGKQGLLACRKFPRGQQRSRDMNFWNGSRVGFCFHCRIVSHRPTGLLPPCPVHNFDSFASSGGHGRIKVRKVGELRRSPPSHAQMPVEYNSKLKEVHTDRIGDFSFSTAAFGNMPNPTESFGTVPPCSASFRTTSTDGLA